jgi:bacterioferritin-associated ferredoxin
MYVCICQAVSERTIRHMLTYMTPEQVKDETGACNVCTMCESEFMQLVNKFNNGG